jgi:beta-phosphoglucomutase-like phosphatase (HAD superfamily)
LLRGSRAAKEFGLEAPVELYAASIGTSSEATRARLSGHFGDAFDMEALWNGASGHFRLLADTQLDLLDSLKLPAAICNVFEARERRAHLEAQGLECRFRAVAAKGSYARSTPHPEPFLKVAELIGARPSSCIALEDPHNGVRSASSAGMMTIMVPKANDEMRGLCAHVAADLHEVARLIEAAVGGGG